MLRSLSLAAPFAALLVVAACSTSSSSAAPTNSAISPPANCNQDDMLECSQGSTGFACQSGTNPQGEDDTLACSTPVVAGNTDEYCCFSVPADDADSSACQPDDTVACPTSTVGYSCATGDDPTSLDSTLTCSAPSTSDDDGGVGVTEYCCAKSGTVTGDDDDDDQDASPPAGCTTDGTVTCTGDSVGYSCGTGVNPGTVDPSLACSAPTAGASGQELYCCFTGFEDPSAGTCQPDDDVTLACASGTFGFSCAAGDSDPTTQDARLSACSASGSVGDEDDYCCAYE